MDHDKEKDQEKDLGTQGAQDALKGKANQVIGKVQEKTGQVLGDKSTEGKGKARQVGGKVQEKVGQGEQKVDEKLKEHNL